MKFYLSIASTVALGALVFITGLCIETAVADEHKATSAVILAQCGKIIGLIAIDEHGGLHPVPPEVMSDELLGKVLKEVGESYVTAVAPCRPNQPVI